MKVKYREEYSSSNHGRQYILGYIIIGFIAFSIEVVFILSAGSQDALSGERGFAYQLATLFAFAIFGFLILSLITYGVLTGIKLLRSSKNWMVEITQDKLVYQIPDETIYKSLSCELSDITHVKRVVKEFSDLEDNECERWFICMSDEAEYELYSYSVLDSFRLKSALLNVCPHIQFFDEKYFNNKLIQGDVR